MHYFTCENSIKGNCKQREENMSLNRFLYLSISGLLIILSTVIIPAKSFTQPSFMITAKGVEVGSLAPEFTFQDASGKWVSLSDFRGKKVFLFSWSSWCRCKYQLPAIEKFYRQYKSDNFEVIAVASDSQGFKWAREYLDIADASFVSLVDPDNSLGVKYHFWATENGWLIDEGGMIRMNVLNFDIHDPAQERELVKLMNTDFNAIEKANQPTPIKERLKTTESSLAQNPRQPDLILELAELYRIQGDYDKAEDILTQALKKRKLWAKGHYNLGVVLYHKGQIEQAVAKWEKASMLEPTNYLYMRNVQAYKNPDKFYAELKQE